MLVRYPLTEVPAAAALVDASLCQRKWSKTIVRTILPLLLGIFISATGWLESLPALVGNKRVYGGWGMLVSYYLPGNSLAAPPSHRVGGATANVEVQQGFLIPSHLSGGWEVQHSFWTPSHPVGWEVQHT